MKLDDQKQTQNEAHIKLLNRMRKGLYIVFTIAILATVYLFFLICYYLTNLIAVN